MCSAARRVSIGMLQSCGVCAGRLLGHGRTWQLPRQLLQLWAATFALGPLPTIAMSRQLCAGAREPPHASVPGLFMLKM